jgi:hypothetical protein
VPGHHARERHHASHNRVPDVAERSGDDVGYPARRSIMEILRLPLSPEQIVFTLLPRAIGLLIVGSIVVIHAPHSAGHRPQTFRQQRSHGRHTSRRATTAEEP